MVIFGVQTSWWGQRTPKTIDHRWSMPHHDYLLHAVGFFFFFFFSIFHKNYTRNFFSEPWDLGLLQIAKYHIFDALWHWKGGGQSKCIVGYILPSFQSHNASHLSHNVSDMWYSLLQYWANYYNSTLIAAAPKYDNRQN